MFVVAIAIMIVIGDSALARTPPAAPVPLSMLSKALTVGVKGRCDLRGAAAVLKAQGRLKGESRFQGGHKPWIGHMKCNMLDLRNLGLTTIPVGAAAYRHDTALPLC